MPKACSSHQGRIGASMATARSKVRETIAIVKSVREKRKDSRLHAEASAK
jgi:hypothetical protein